MNTWKNLRSLLLLAACTLSLSACLPEDNDPAKIASADTRQDNGAYYGSALGNIALQIQNAVVSDTAWFANMTQSQELDLASMGIATDNLPATVKSHVCPTGNGAEVVQLTWFEGRDADGKFSLKGTGNDAAGILAALRSRVSSDQLGTAMGGRLAMTNNETTAMPESCLGVRIPDGTPVLSFRITRPATPTTMVSRIEYRSLACADVQGVKQTGARVQRRIVTYNTDGTISPTAPEQGWLDEDMGECINSVDVAVVSTPTTKNLTSVLDSFAAMSLRTILAEQIANMGCQTSTVKADNMSGKKESIGGNASGARTSQKDIDTCGEGANVTGASAVTDADGSTDTDERVLSCAGSSSGLANGAIIGVNGDVSTQTVWSGTATLIRTRKTTTSSDDSESVGISNWIGKDHAVNCTGDETINVNCGQIPGIPAGTASDDKWLTISTAPAYHWRGGWGTTWDCASFGVAGSGFNIPGLDCINVQAETVTYLNDNYYKGAKNTLNSGVTVKDTARVTEWADPIKFEVAEPSSRTNHTMTRNQCAWDVRTMGECPEPASVTEAGSWTASTINPADPMPKTYSNTPATAVIYNETNDKETDEMKDHIAKLRQTVIDEYATQKATGKLVSYVERKYTKYVDFGIWGIGKTGGVQDKGYVRYGQGPDLYMKSTTSGVNLDGLVALSAQAQSYRTAACAGGQITGANAAICNPAIVVLDSAQKTLTRNVCQMQDNGTVKPNVTGALKTYCEYIFDEMIYDLGSNRRYRYHFREMAAPGKFVQTTLLNKSGVVEEYKPVFTGGNLLVQAAGFKIPLQCARNEVEEVEVALQVKYRSNWGNSRPAVRSSSTVNSKKVCQFIFWCETNYYVTYQSTAVFKKTTVREYDATKGWSKPRVAYRSDTYGTKTTLPAKVTLDLSKGCEGDDDACDNRNNGYAGRPD